jgi:hypothetical protein
VKNLEEAFHFVATLVQSENFNSAY